MAQRHNVIVSMDSMPYTGDLELQRKGQGHHMSAHQTIGGKLKLGVVPPGTAKVLPATNKTWPYNPNIQQNNKLWDPLSNLAQGSQNKIKEKHHAYAIEAGMSREPGHQRWQKKKKRFYTTKTAYNQAEEQIKKNLIQSVFKTLPIQTN